MYVAKEMQGIYGVSVHAQPKQVIMLCSPVIMLFILGTSSYHCDVWDAEESSGPGGLSTNLIVRHKTELIIQSL